QRRLHRVEELGQLGERGGHVLAAAAGQAHRRAADRRDHAHAVPFHLVGPVVLVADVLAPPEGREHRGERLAQLGDGGVLGGGGVVLGGGGGVVGARRVGLGLVLHEVQQPVRLRL